MSEARGNNFTWSFTAGLESIFMKMYWEEMRVSINGE